MIPGTEDLPDDALRDVAYLAKSGNRVRILGALAKEAGTPKEVADRSGASRSTLQRILTELDDRGWARRNRDGLYEATPSGRHVVDQLVPFVESIATIRALGDEVAWLPNDGLSIGLHHFRDATVRRPTPNDPMAPGMFMIDLVRDAAELNCLVHLAAPMALLQGMRDKAVGGDLESEHVLTKGLVEYIRDDGERTRIWSELESSGSDVYCYDDEIPCNLFRFDETVVLGRTPPRGESCAFVVSENETVLAWAREMIAEHREKATRIPVEKFAADGAVE